MKAKVIKTRAGYSAARARVEKLMDAKSNTAQGEEIGDALFTDSRLPGQDFSGVAYFLR
jgi:hypothetical protein